ncbi:hypothetical protein H7J87_35090 [Mycolicibacterium wolinskyi]|uniref:Uncharacterized protein n=1 Tax=Mycolicibacterium wolinskyi TaxID=59750 RepID=A0A1X2FEM8_9MYCO|nr:MULTISPECIES: hypothetical protein [Mycolicibacterium]MCV7290564.1 hypothetical protein [Mycolicibacterium wolinskyi]MCV7291614.1 hypothetical protein [Mycolicibacterium goodii]ORX16895.1 hypothetical protein AWC31_18750 [Mycolicibacterium wolinskyi]
MANELEVNVDGLRIAAAASEIDAATIASATTYRNTSVRPSSAGISAIEAAVASVRRRQIRWISGQAIDLREGADSYDSADEVGADAITKTV